MPKMIFIRILAVIDNLKLLFEVDGFIRNLTSLQFKEESPKETNEKI